MFAMKRQFMLQEEVGRQSRSFTETITLIGTSFFLDALVVSIQDFESACERVLGGMKKSTGFINKDQRRTVAFHEAGHAVAGWFLKYGDPVLKVSIVPRTNGALGFAQNLPEEIQLLPRQQVLDKIAVLLGMQLNVAPVIICCLRWSGV